MAQYRQRPPGIPSPSIIAERFATVSGDDKLLPERYPYAVRREHDYSITGVGNDQFNVMLHARMPSGNTTLVLGQIGQYDPGTDRWRFAPEYVTGPERARLAPYVTNELAPGARRISRRLHVGSDGDGELVVDTHHANTRRVRRQIAQQLRPLDVQALLARARPQHENGSSLERLVVDEYAVTYAAIGARIYVGEEQEAVGVDDTITHEVTHDTGERSLLITSLGVQVDNPGYPGHTARTEMAVEVAHSDDTRSVWTPNLEVISAAEWEFLAPLPGILQLAEVTYPDFSGYHAAVAHNSRMGGTNQPLTGMS
jgi:hypothetical protein